MKRFSNGATPCLKVPDLQSRNDKQSLQSDLAQAVAIVRYHLATTDDGEGCEETGNQEQEGEQEREESNKVQFWRWRL
eukprot:symbB.v1.2.028149.t1/scaffold2954.1/size66569/6